MYLTMTGWSAFEFPGFFVLSFGLVNLFFPTVFDTVAMVIILKSIFRISRW